MTIQATHEKPVTGAAGDIGAVGSMREFVQRNAAAFTRSEATV